MTNARRMLARAPYFIVDDLSLLDLHEKRRSHQTVQQWHVFTLFWKLLEKPKWPPFMTISILAQEVNSSMDSSILEKKLYLFAANILVHIPPFIWTFGCIPVGMASSVDFNSFFTFLLQFSPHGHYSITYIYQQLHFILYTAYNQEYSQLVRQLFYSIPLPKVQTLFKYHCLSPLAIFHLQRLFTLSSIVINR